MKANLLKRLSVLAMVAIMLLTSAVPAFAAEVVSESTVSSIDSETLPEVAESSSETRNTSGNVTLALWDGSGSFYVTLDSYVGFTKTFHIETACKYDDGLIIVVLERVSDGKVVSNDWYADPNGHVSWDFFLPTSGVYKVTVSANATSGPTYVEGYWT